MATADQIKALIRSYASADQEHFFAIALQVAARGRIEYAKKDS